MSSTDRPGRFRLGVDIGGTFTDLVLLDTKIGQTYVGKVLTTPEDPSVGALEGAEALLSQHGLTVSDLELVMHGTTLVANALIERRGAETALLTTSGFRDTLEIGTGRRYDMYNYFLEFPKPLVPRRRRVELAERVLHDGTVWKELNREDVDAAVRGLIDDGVEAFAVCFLHSFVNPRHEREVGQYFADTFPDIPLTLSSDLVDEIGEVERVSTAVANAYVQPLTQRYLRKLADAFATAGPSPSSGSTSCLYLMVSSGGAASVETASSYPIQLVESGPAAGALAAALYSRLTSNPRVISFDMGGTTAKACLVEDGTPASTNEMEVAREERFKKGSGIPLKVPVIDLIEIGAGGGSIAKVDELGLLKVGPSSAGADPGPACYGRGGAKPTVTDANLLLGYLDPDYFLGGQMKLEVSAAREAIQNEVAKPLGIDVVSAAWGIHEIVNENMSGAARTHVAERNRDPRRFAMVAFGGAGPIHARSVAEKIHVPQVVVPLAAGAASALGLLVAPPAYDLSHSYVGTLGDLDWDRVRRVFTELEDRGRKTLATTGVPAHAVGFERYAEMRYVGQFHQIRVPLAPELLEGDPVDAFTSAFCDHYSATYGVLNPEYPIEVLVWRVRAVGPAQRVNLAASLTEASGDSVKSSRSVYFPDSGFVSCAVYDHYSLRPGARLDGPAIVEQRESTTVIGPRDRARVDDLLNLIIDVARA